MRNGPKPLPFQLGMASIAAAGLAGGTSFDAHILQDFFKGIQKYQKHDFKREMPELTVVWSLGQTRLFGAPEAKSKTHKTPIVLVPSMINKSDILDLLPDRSLLRWLAGQGFEVYLLDWGKPTVEGAEFNMDEAVQKFAEHLCTYNPEAMMEMKKIFWRGTEDWDNLLAERAAISGRLVLSDFTKETLKKFK
jgi:hypothetical protein